jgi:hypothetical protein
MSIAVLVVPAMVVSVVVATAMTPRRWCCVRLARAARRAAVGRGESGGGKAYGRNETDKKGPALHFEPPVVMGPGASAGLRLARRWMAAPVHVTPLVVITPESVEMRERGSAMCPSSVWQ